MQGIDLYYFSQLGQTLGVVFFIGGQCFKGTDHLVENIHESDYFQVIFALPAGEGLQLDHLPNFQEGQFGKFPDKFLHEEDKKFDVVVIEA